MGRRLPLWVQDMKILWAINNTKILFCFNYSVSSVLSKDSEEYWTLSLAREQGNGYKKRDPEKGDFCGDPWKMNPRKEVICVVLLCKKLTCIKSCHIQGTTSVYYLGWSIFDTEFLQKRYVKYLYHLIKNFLSCTGIKRLNNRIWSM